MIGLSEQQKFETFRYLFILGLFITFVAVIVPKQFQTDVLVTGLVTVSVGFVGWTIVDEPKPIPFLWWLLGWRVENIQELGDLKISMYYRWLQFKNSERLVFFRKYTSREIAEALDSCESEIHERSSLVLTS